MQDRFRFRVFYKPQNKIYNVICLNSDKQKEIIIEYKGSSAIVEWENCNILQCTGLKDKNGKLIYEGDIVKMPFVEPILNYMPSEENTEFAKIEEFKGCFTILYLDNSQRAYLYQWSDKIEVIGNIYETPELLKEYK